MKSETVQTSKMYPTLLFLFSQLSLIFYLCPVEVLCSNFSILNSDEEFSKGIIEADVNSWCTLFADLPNGNVTVTTTNNIRIVHFSCNPGYHLMGSPKFICDDFIPRPNYFEKPVCSKACHKPPMVINGEVIVNGQKDDNNLFLDGVVAEYNCINNYRLMPITSQHRICRDGEWTGTPASCVFQGCPKIGGVANGFTVLKIDDIKPKDLLSDGVFNPFDLVREGIIMHYKCNPGYSLVGPPIAKCMSTGIWLPSKTPICTKNLYNLSSEFYPPIKDYSLSGVDNGSNFCSPLPLTPHLVQTFPTPLSEGETPGPVPDGSVYEFTCTFGYRDKLTPCQPQALRCDKGHWIGSLPNCAKADECVPWKVPHGDYEVVNGGGVKKDRFSPGGQVLYSCAPGYQLAGVALYTCQIGGCWSPSVKPICEPGLYHDNGSNFCSPLPLGPHLVQMFPMPQNNGETPGPVSDGSVYEFTCAFGYRDKLTPCQPQVLRCDKGRWIGSLPNCVKADECIPPKVPHGDYEVVNGGGLRKDRFSPGGQVIYSCVPGYQLAGVALYTCQIGGCWDPNNKPICEPGLYLSTNWPEYLNTNTSLLFSVITAMSVLFVLLSVCIAVVCRHRPTPAMHHHHLAPPTTPPTIVPPLPDPDRVALIAFADGIQSGLPTYEEAVRGSGGTRGLLSYRLHHPPWAQRRNPRADTTIIARQLSSTGDSMGSTDTMTVSDVSTNVTLDTVSSHTCSSTSQTASCRAICGSLASFDTSSVLNTEGVPLLEENELEENGINTDIEDGSGPPACDNTSFKLQSDIDSIHS